MDVTFTNPRTSCEFYDWPLGGRKGRARFEVEFGPANGERIARYTELTNGEWSNPRRSPWANQVRIVDGDDERTYILLKDEEQIGILPATMKASDIVHVWREGETIDEYYLLRELFE